MNIPSVTATPLPATVAQTDGKASAPPEARVTSPPPVAAAPGVANAPPARTGAQGHSEQEVQAAVDNIEKFVARNSPDITFSIDKEDGFMVKVIDRTSHDVILQIPSEEAIAISRALDKLQGLFVRAKI
ncbi:MAG: flagellar protein FlaG [Desulfobulbus sp.]|nr:flagellar protein FlaG [Desulfobulbus sp.]